MYKIKNYFIVECIKYNENKRSISNHFKFLLELLILNKDE